MKKHILSTLSIGLLSQLSFAQAEISSFQPYEGSQICVNAVADHYWVYGSGSKHGAGFYHDFNGWKYLEFDTKNRGNIKDMIGEYGELTVLTDKDVLWHYSGNNKTWIENKGITNIKDFVKHSNDLFVIGTVKQADGSSQTGLFKARLIGQRESDWTPVITGQMGGAMQKLDTDKMGNLFIVSSGGVVNKLPAGASALETFTNQTTGQTVVATDIHVTYDGAVYIKDSYHTIYKYNTSSKNYEQAKASGHSWDVANSGKIYYCLNNRIEMVENGKMTILSADNPNKLNSDGNTMITEAVLLNSVSKFNDAIALGADVNAPNAEGTPPVILAVRNNKSGMIMRLAEQKADMNKTDKDGKSALYYAAQMNNSVVMGTLLTNGADASDSSVLDLAVRGKNTQLINLLAANKADFSDALTTAAETNDASLFKTLIVTGAKPKDLEPFKKAVDNNNKEIAEMCIDNGSDKNQGLDYAIEKKNTDIIGLCLTKGAEPKNAVAFAVRSNDLNLSNKIMDDYKVHPDHFLNAALPEKQGAKTRTVAEEANYPIMEIALKKGASADKYVDRAISNNDKRALELLLTYGGNPNTVLKAAVNNNNMEFAQLAVSKGARVTDDNLLKKSVSGDNVEMSQLLIGAGALATDPILIDSAVTHKNLEMATLLLNSGANAHEPKLLRTAVNNQQKEMVELLVNKGANPSLAIKDAVNTNNTDISVYLLDQGASALDPDLMAKASANGNMTLVSKLLEKGGNANDGTKAAITARKSDVLNLLISRGGSVATADHMYLAVASMSEPIFDMVKGAGAPTSWKSSSGENLLHVVSRSTSAVGIAKKLVASGVDVNAKDNSGDTPLHVAANSGRNNTDMCVVLVDAGADVNAENNRGKSIYKVADGRKLKNYLKSKGAKK